MTALLGGFEITQARWKSSMAIEVQFTTTYTTKYHQLYAGRKLIGTTSRRDQKVVTGHLKPSNWPQLLILTAVDPANRLTSYGSTFAPDVFNVAQLVATCTDGVGDWKWLDLVGGASAGDAVDSANLIRRVPFDVDREYTLLSEPRAGSGTHNFELIGRDDKPGVGNAGTALALSIDLDSTPPDVPFRSDGSRFTYAISSQTLTATATYPSLNP